MAHQRRSPGLRPRGDGTRGPRHSSAPGALATVGPGLSSPGLCTASACLAFVLLSAGLLGVLMGIILLVAPGIAAPLLPPVVYLSNGSIFCSSDVITPAWSYGGEQYEVIRFMQKSADEPNTLEPEEREYVDQLAAEIQTLEGIQLVSKVTLFADAQGPAVRVSLRGEFVANKSRRVFPVRSAARRRCHPRCPNQHSSRPCRRHEPS